MIGNSMKSVRFSIPVIGFILLFQLLQAPVSFAEPKLQAVLPCSVSNELPCLDAITAIDSKGKSVKAIMLSKSRKYPQSFAGQSTQPVDNYEWQIPGTKHENGNDRVSVNVMYFPYGAKYCWLENQCSTGVDEIILNLSGAWWDNQPAPTEFPNQPSNKMCGTKENPQVCIRGWGSDKNFQYSFDIKVSQDFSFSHANGEARNGSIYERINSKNEKILTISATPVDLSFIYTTDINTNTILTQQRADVTFAQLSAYIQSTKSDQSKWLEKCNYGKGMSLWYSGQLMSFPQWFPDDGSIGIGLASTHLRSDGTDNVGAFNIAMPLETAKCLWGVDLSKSISASISALYEETGSKEVVTTSTSVVNGYFNVNASGFHFSSPNFRVKLKQEVEASQSPTPSPESTAQPIAVVIKKTTVTCIKGKTSKKVIAVKPKCPAGYKKK
jgi:hypothetical protein